jgi:putative ABC transport system ATP-binding protein
VDHHSKSTGGQRQRVAVARAFKKQTLDYSADEPTGNLDSKTCRRNHETFNEIHANGNTVILVTRRRNS